MPRLTADQWADVRADREAGMSFKKLAVKYDVSDAAICKRAQREGWLDGSDVGDVIRRKVNEKVNAVSPSPAKRAATIDAAADQAVRIVARHRDDWERHHQVFGVDGIANNFELGKSAKISSEMLAIRQKAERIAWNLDEAETSKPEIVIQWSTLAVEHG